MHDLDSRFLGPFDCFGQRFMKAGRYPYRIARAGLTGVADDFPYLVQVAEAPAERRMVQHLALVRAEGQTLAVDQKELHVQVGDLVLWHGPRLARPFAVEGAKAFFNSTRLSAEAGYSHVFGVPGEYHWVDAHGSRLRGRVVVAPVCATTEAHRRQWVDQARQGSLVMITGDRAEPEELHIVAGQTVYFALTKTPGVSITDARLVTGDAGGRAGC
jgi:plastocyanin